MDALSFSLKNLALTHAGEGSKATQANRHRGLQLMARELKALGYKLPDYRSLKPKHVDQLVTNWKTTGISDRTIRNRLGWLRWWGEKTNKPGLLPATNERFGLAERSPYQGNRAKFFGPEVLATVADERVRLALRLEQAFGLRREEALKFRVGVADKGDHIQLMPTWCKGGRPRTVPIVHPGQKALLDEVRALCGSGSLVPDGQTYVRGLKRYENQLLKAGLSNAHGLRHWYAQWRYKSLTGRDCPAAGGEAADRLPPDEARRDFTARMQISRELGHGRIGVTDTYLGRRVSK